MSSVFTGAYVTGLFSDHTWAGEATQQQMTASAMGDAVIWTLHVTDGGDLHYNDEALVVGGQTQPAYDSLKAFVSALKTQGSVTRVWFGIGSAAVQDFQNIQAIFSAGGATEDNLFTNFGKVADLGVTGFDLDYEENISNAADTIAQLGYQLNKRFGSQITYCPYMDQSFWIDCLTRTHALAGNAQPVVGYNLQCYAGGSWNNPSDWVAGIRAVASSVGIASPAAFVRPILAVSGQPDASPQKSPNQVTSSLDGWGSKGGSIWNTEGCLQGPSPVADYAQAILKATG